MELNDAETQLISLLRGEDLADFTLTIQTNAGYWYAKLRDHKTGKEGDGEGAAFSAAWDDLAPRELRG
jgi:hypothetical protein